MADFVSIRCPHCRVTMKLKSRKPLGKRVPCPRCQEPFVAKALPEPEDEFDDFGFDDDFGGGGGASGFDDLFGAEQAPPLAAAGRPKKKPRKKSGPPPWLQPALIGGGGLLALLLLAGGAFLAVKAFRSGDAADLAAYVPADADFFAVARIDKMRESPMLKELFDNPIAQNGFANDDMRKMGIKSIDDVRTIAIAGSLDAFAGGGAMPFASPEGFVIMIQTNSGMNIGALKRGGERNSHNGTTYYIDKQAVAGTRWAWISPNRKTVVAAPAGTLKKVIDQSKKGKREDLAFVDFEQHVVFAYAPGSGSIVPAEAKGQSAGAPPSLQKIATSVENDVKAGAVGLTFKDGVDVKLQGSCRDSEAAERLKTGLDEAIAEGKNNNLLGPAALFMPADATKLIKDVMESVAVTKDGSSVSLTASIPESATSSLQSLAMGGNPFKGFGGGANAGRNRTPGNFGRPDMQPPEIGSPPATPTGFGPGAAPQSGHGSQFPGPGATPPGIPADMPTGPPGFPGDMPPGSPPGPVAGHQPPGPGSPTRGGATITFQMLGFSGAGDAASAAAQAVRRTPGYATASVQVDDSNQQIVVSNVPGGFINTAPLKAALVRAGFQIGSTSLNTRGSASRPPNVPRSSPARGTRVTAYSIELRAFNGRGDAAAAARQALANVRGIDADRTEVMPDGRQVKIYSEPGQFLSLASATANLRNAGFRPGGFRRISAD